MIRYSGHDDGMQGSTVKVVAAPAQAEDALDARRDTSSRPIPCTSSSRRARRAAGARRRRRRSRTARSCSGRRRRRVRAWLTGFSMWKNSAASSPLPSLRQRHHDPDGRVRVLAAVLADAGRIALDVAGILRRLDRTAGRAAAASASRARSATCARRPSRARRSAAAPRRTAPPTTARSNRCGTRRSAPIRAACRRRSSRAGTTRRPTPVRAAPARRRASFAIAVGARASSPRAAQSGAKSREHGVEEEAEPRALAAARRRRRGSCRRSSRRCRRAAGRARRR